MNERKYQLINELTFKAGLVNRYAIIVEHRDTNRMDPDPYVRLLATAIAEMSAAYDELVPILTPTKEVA